MSRGPSGSQQISFGPQHSFPQHVIADWQEPPSIAHGVGTHLPLPSQKGAPPVQTTPHPPQLCGSLAVYVHWPLQQA
jgi:hypothetical protein